MIAVQSATTLPGGEMGKQTEEGAERETGVAVTRLKQRLEHWRQGRKRGERIPEVLWRAARKLAQRLGLAPTVRLLKLDYYTLKHRLEGKALTEPAFIELDRVSAMPGNTSQISSSQAEWSIEIEERRGLKLRVQYKGLQAPDLGLLGRSFLGTCK
jgi:hypothetical protein